VRPACRPRRNPLFVTGNAGAAHLGLEPAAEIHTFRAQQPEEIPLAVRACPIRRPLYISEITSTPSGRPRYPASVAALSSVPVFACTTPRPIPPRNRRRVPVPLAGSSSGNC
jgi:hypothetical protein